MNYVFVLPSPSMDEASEWLETMEENGWLGCRFALLHPDNEEMRMVSAALAMDLEAEIRGYPAHLGLSTRQAAETELLEIIWKACRSAEEGILVVLVEKFSLATSLTRRLLEEKLDRGVQIFRQVEEGEAYCLDLRRRKFLSVI